MDPLGQNIRHAVRQLRKSPGFAIVAILTLALGIGANTAIFSVVNGVLLEPLPFDEPDRLVSLGYTAPGLDLERVSQAAALHFTYLDENRSFESVGMWLSGSVSVSDHGAPEEVEGITLTHTTFPILRVRPAIGRTFDERDDAPGAAPTVILGHGYWQTRFGGDPDVVGQMLTVNGQSREIIGVMPPNPHFLDYHPAVYQPFGFNPAAAGHGCCAFVYQGVARLRQGVSLEQANADVERMVPLAVQRFPGTTTDAMLEQAGFGPRLRPLKEDVVGDVGNVLWVLLGTTGIVLLIACANVANLFLVRANEREAEIAVRAALGASRATLGRQFLTESMTLGLLGGIGGLALAYAAVDLLHLLAPEGLPRLDEIGIRPVVLLFTLGLAFVVGLVFGLVPLLRRGGDLSGTLKEGGGRGGGTGKGRSRVRDTLVTAQVALALVLLVGAGLMIRSLLALGEVRPGFERPEEVLTVGVSLPSAEMELEQAPLAFQQMQGNLEAIPGVVSVGGASRVTMDNGVRGGVGLYVDDFPVPEGQIAPVRRYTSVLPGYFETLQNPLLAGRPISWADINARAPVVVITENLALEYWDNAAAAIGKHVREVDSEDGPWREIIGVVGDVRDDGLSEDPVPTVFWPVINQQFQGNELTVSWSMTFAIRTSRLGSASFMEEVSAAIWAVNPSLPLANVRTLREILDRSTARTSFALVMLTIAAAAALLLGAVGIFGVTSYAVAQRRHELGVRMALGAQREHISRLVLRHALVLAGLGAAAGVAMAVGLTRLMSALLYGVSAVDPLTFAVVILFVGGTALLATWIPARRAAHVDPTSALKNE